MLDVVVVGSGPNGLAAAVTLARSGLSVRVLEANPSIGGGARTLPADWSAGTGLVHDVCSAVHPLALASPFLRGFDLAARGVDLVVPDVSFAHPLDHGVAGIAFRDLAATRERLRDVAGARVADQWYGMFAPLAGNIDDVVRLMLGDRRTLVAAPPLPTALRLTGRILGAGARTGNGMGAAMFAGLASHAITPLPSLPAAGTALLLGALAHAGGWSIPRGGSQAITDALARDLAAHGGSIETGRQVRDAGDLPPARAYLLNTSPRTALRIAGDHLSAKRNRQLGAYRYGNGAAKVDYVLTGPVPWADADVGRAATVHVGGAAHELAAAEHEVAHGRHAARPVALVSDPTIADPTREQNGLRPLWAYAHVPAHSTLDVTEHVTAQIERFAPGFRDLIHSAHCTPASRMADANENYVGGDIAAGAITITQMLARPRLTIDPYRLGDNFYLCSAATPPGPGVHGMGGWAAARSVLANEFQIRNPPQLSP